MRLTILSCILSLATLGVSQDTSLEEVVKAFSDAHIPKDLFIKFDPKVLLEVTFPQISGKAITLHAGLQLPRNATAGPPTFKLFGTPNSGPFVVATVDPDAPTPQDTSSSQIRHFLGGNFELGPLHNLRNRTAAVSEFRQPTPPAGSDAHRYVFLVFKQPAGFNQQTLVTPTTSIALFNISSFASAVGLGDPLGGTFMLVAPDPPPA